MHPQNFMIFGTYIPHNAENETMLSLCHYIDSFSPEGATNMSTFYLHYSSFTYFLLIVYIEMRMFTFFFAFITKIL